MINTRMLKAAKDMNSPKAAEIIRHLVECQPACNEMLGMIQDVSSRQIAGADRDAAWTSSVLCAISSAALNEMVTEEAVVSLVVDPAIFVDIPPMCWMQGMTTFQDVLTDSLELADNFTERAQKMAAEMFEQAQSIEPMAVAHPDMVPAVIQINVAMMLSATFCMRSAQDMEIQKAQATN